MSDSVLKPVIQKTLLWKAEQGILKLGFYMTVPIEKLLLY